MSFKSVLSKLPDTTTENNSPAYSSTSSFVLDMFSRMGAMRNSDPSEVVELFKKAYQEDRSLALKCLFYVRDIRMGQGERNVFRIILKSDIISPEILKQLVPFIGELGRFDDLLSLPVSMIVDYIQHQLYSDSMNEPDRPVSLLAKWLPSENTSCKNTVKKARELIKALGMTPKNYRLALSTLRKRIKIVETNLAQNTINDIEYSKVPSKAMLKYRKAFSRRDEERFNEFIQQVKEKKVKINTGTIQPYEIVKKLLQDEWGFGGSCVENDPVLEEIWKNLPDKINERNQNAIVMADVSGSMFTADQLPICNSIALAIYFAERNQLNTFKNCFLTFSEDPQFVEINPKLSLMDKIDGISKAKWGYNTDLNKAFKMILKRCVDGNVLPEDMPKILYIISDMQFDDCGKDRTNFEEIEKQYKKAGYTRPHIVFWNVNAHDNSPVKKDENGVTLVSGYSSNTFNFVVEGKTPYEFMMGVLGIKRYRFVDESLKKVNQ